MTISWLLALNALALGGGTYLWFFLQARHRQSAHERHLLESAFNQGTPVCITDVNFEVIKANEAYWSVFGRQPDPKRPLKCFEHRPGKACHTDNCPLTNILKGQPRYICEPQKEYNGELHYFLVVAQPFYDNDRGRQKVTGVIEVFYDITDRKRLENEKAMVIADLKESLRKVKLLSGLIPICAACKKVRDDHGYWSQVESYISKRSEAMFSHGICPDCVKTLYPEVYQEVFPNGHQPMEEAADSVPDLHLLLSRRPPLEAGLSKAA